MKVELAMYDEQEWEMIRPKPDTASMFASGALRLSLIFGGFFIVIALLLVPFINPDSPRRLAIVNNPGIDPMTTATVRKPARTYTVRRSVLQSSPADVCIIRENGTFEGDC
jgi:hypothetical protein